MNDAWQEAGEWATVIATGAFFIFLGVAWVRRKRAKTGCVPDRPAQPYTIYTKEFDLTLRGCEVPNVLSGDPFLNGKGWVLRDPHIWRNKVERAREIAAFIKDTGVFAEDGPLDGWAICFLVDQSGSMRDEPIAQVAATLWVQVGHLMKRGASVSVLGFSTVGWHGGKARQKWLFGGQPKRPGRLCALLHVIYQEFGEQFERDDWDAMLHPDILRENVDGEALNWAVQRLYGHPSQRRALIVVSDGASVDDTTIIHNGTGYLERHLQSVIREIEGRQDIVLGAIGVGFDVGRYYLSESAKRLDDLPMTISRLINRMTLLKRDEKK